MKNEKYQGLLVQIFDEAEKQRTESKVNTGDASKVNSRQNSHRQFLQSEIEGNNQVIGSDQNSPEKNEIDYEKELEQIGND